MKKIIPLIILICSFNSFANQLSDEERAHIGMKKALSEMNGINDASSSPSAGCSNTNNANTEFPPLDPMFMKGGTQCDNFISSDGNGDYGPWGDTVVSYIRATGEDSEFLKDDIFKFETICPSWKNLNRAEREHVWVWIMASIAKVESTCNPKARNGQSTNGVAVGLLQLDEKKAARSWRGEACKIPSVLQPENNIKCGLDIMEEMLKGKEGDYKSNGSIYGKGSNSYWQHLKKKDGGGIVDLISLNPLCQEK